MLHKHMKRWRDYCTISRQIPAWKIFCFVLRKATISHALKRKICQLLSMFLNSATVLTLPLMLNVFRDEKNAKEGKKKNLKTRIKN